MENKKPYLFVATPMYGGLCNGQYAVGLLRMVGVFGQAGIQMQYAYMMNESLITRARDSLAYDFLQTDCTHLMFIDADIGFRAEHIPPMIEADKDIICGMYPKKEINWNQVAEAVKNGVPPQELHNYTGVFVVNAVDGAEELYVHMNEPIQIANGGTGFMLIKREVIEGLLDKVPQYNSDMFTVVDEERRPKRIHQLFDTSIDVQENERLLSEDYHFCKLARDNGYTIWAAPWAKLDHCGAYIFSGAFRGA
jgi:hypothetical protein